MLSLKYSVNILLTCTLYYDARPGYLISSIRTVCKHRKCSFLTGLITSMTDLLQAYHQGRKGTSKTKSTGSPVPVPIALLSEFFCFALAEIFSVLARSPYTTEIICISCLHPKWNQNPWFTQLSDRDDWYPRFFFFLIWEFLLGGTIPCSNTYQYSL